MICALNVQTNCYTPEIDEAFCKWQKLSEKMSRHSQKSYAMYWNIIVYPFNCLSWPILTPRGEKYGYSIIESRWCVRVFFCLWHIYAILFLHLWHIVHLIFLLMTWWWYFRHIKWLQKSIYEPPNDKTNKMTVRPAKTQISLESAWRKLGSWATHWAHSEDSDQTGRMSRLIWVFAGCTVLSWGGSVILYYGL